MRLSDVMYMLETGELSNLSLVDTETGTILPERYGKIVTSVNLAIADLHQRFLMKKGQLTVVLREGQVVYPLTTRYVMSDKNKPEEFIQNGEGISTLLKILEVRDQRGKQLPLNNGDPRKGISTPSFNVLNVSEHLYGEWSTRTLDVEYQKTGKPIALCDKDFDPECVEVDLDSRYLNALVLFVASRLHNPSGFGTEGVHEGNNYHSLYMEECVRLSNTGQAISENGHGYIHRAGWA